MQYMLLIYDDEANWGKMPEGEQGRMMQEFRDFTESIVKSGNYRAGDQLQPIATATTVRGTNGKVLLTDGPYAEAKEQLGGYYLVEAKDLDEAVQMAKRIPSVRLGGGVEVRPVVPRPPGALTEAVTASPPGIVWPWGGIRSKRSIASTTGGSWPR